MSCDQAEKKCCYCLAWPYNCNLLFVTVFLIVIFIPIVFWRRHNFTAASESLIVGRCTNLAVALRLVPTGQTAPPQGIRGNHWDFVRNCLFVAAQWGVTARHKGGEGHSKPPRSHPCVPPAVGRLSGRLSWGRTLASPAKKICFHSQEHEQRNSCYGKVQGIMLLWQKRKRGIWTRMYKCICIVLPLFAMQKQKWNVCLYAFGTR